MIVALAGGVGGAKLAHGLYKRALAGELTVIVNTADDFDLWGLRVMPDTDTVLYTLAGVANAQTGWGIADDTFATLGMLARYGAETWFQVGDRDFATHIQRTRLLREGRSYTEVVGALAEALGIRAAILPMCDTPVATVVRTPDGELAFQDYFVRRRHADEVLGVRFGGIEEAHAPAPALAALASAEAIILCPSNPIVSIGPILAVPDLREALTRSRAPKVAVSPIVGGRALKGPADRMLAGLGEEVSAFGVANHYRDLLNGIVIDALDADDATRIEALGMRVHITDTIMRSEEDRVRLAADVIRFAGTCYTR
ncbi:MAG TPA: 2-phospho-L-lactate transferase [Ktedonobacterales bacterium]|nr:2-phospho-L-lactate transferase [Ktedonobacterales bacterium]